MRAFPFRSRTATTADRDQGQKTPSPTHYNAIRPLLQSPAFIAPEEKSNIWLYDTFSQAQPRQYSSDEFEALLSSTPKPHTRIVSICCKSGMDPLGITESAMQKLMDTYGIDDSFIDSAVLFGDKPRTSDAGHGGMTVRERGDGSLDMHYRFTYAESYKVQLDGPTKFTNRQVCVFHRYSPSGTGSLWVFLHARPDSVLQSKIEEVLSVDPEAGVSDWFSLHLLAFATYIGNWRWCLRNFGERIEEAADIALTMDLSNLKDVSKTENLALLLHPQYLATTIMPFSSQIEVALTTIRKMAEVNEFFLSKGLSTDAQYRRLADATINYTSNLEGYLKSLEALERKVQGYANLHQANGYSCEKLATTLTLNNQTRMLQLTDASVEDNANVQTFLGMNLFDFDGPGDGSFATSNKFWVFFAAAGPLTCFTLGFWYLLTKHRERQRKQFK
ncbi:hypothetical protein BDW62DRAFT_209470 [Aspergillus aurantiobrunneus]